MVRYGAKALPEGGWHTIPRVYADGVLIAGDAGGFLNSMRLKGIHLAMRTGMLAAESRLRRGARRRRLGVAPARATQDAIDRSDVRRELYPVRNVHQSFGYGLLAGVAYSGLSLVTGGWWYRDPMPATPATSGCEDRLSTITARPAGRGRAVQRRRRSIGS